MPLKNGTTTKGGKKKGYYAAAGGKGKKYTYKQGDKKAKASARRKAIKQGRAMAAS